MVVSSRASTRVSLLLLLSFVLGAWGTVACSGQETAPPPVYNRPKGDGGGGGEGGDSGAGGSAGSGNGNCTAERTGCDCEKVGITTPCRVYETFDDYTTCTVGVYTCQDDLTWGECIGERTTVPAAAKAGGKLTRAN
jgi:hypothetical protein